MTKKSVACANICAWTLNIVDYHKIYIKIKPLMETLEGAKTDKRNKEAALAIVEARVKEVEEKVQALKNEL
jgi:dynein heavy chain